MDTITINSQELAIKDVLSELSANKFIVRTEDQDNEYWQNKQKEVVGGKLRDWSENLEGEIAKLTGVERNDSEKSLDFLGRAFGSINEKHNGTVSELAALRKTTSDGEGAASEVQKQFDTFKKAKEKELLELNGKVGTMEGQQFNNKVESAINEAMSKIRPTLQQDKGDNKIIEGAINNTLNEFRSQVNAVDHQGGLIFHDGDNNPLIDKTNGNHLGALEILNERFTYLVDSARVAGGTGAKGNIKSSDGENKYKLQLPTGIDTKMKLTDYLEKDKGLDSNDPEFNKYFQENGATLSLR